MLEVLAASAIVPWILLAIFVASMFYNVEYEKGFSATATMVIASGIAYVLYDFNVISYFLANIKTVLVWFIGYLLIGTIWSIIKWYMYVIAAKNFLIANKFVKFRSALGENKEFLFRGSWQSVPPKFLSNKARFMIWLIYWPISFVWTMINDPVKMAFEWIYSKLGSSMQKISDKVFEDIDIKEK